MRNRVGRFLQSGCAAESRELPAERQKSVKRWNVYHPRTIFHTFSPLALFLSLILSRDEVAKELPVVLDFVAPQFFFFHMRPKYPCAILKKNVLSESEQNIDIFRNENLENFRNETESPTQLANILISLYFDLFFDAFFDGIF